MRIKNQLKTISALAIIVLIIFISFFIVAANKYKTAKSVLNIANEIQINFFESVSFRDQFFLYREDRPREQWITNNQKLDKLLHKLETIKGQDKTLNEIIYSKKKSSALFYRVIANTALLKSSPPNKQVYYEFDNRLISQIYIRYNEFFNSLQEIQFHTEKEVERTYRNLIVAITFFAVILSLIVTFISWHLNGLISRRLEILHAGADIISQGKLEYRINVEGEDEFSDLAASFNSMTTKLQLNNEQLELERSRSVQNAKLASLGEMSASIAHEINNPLSVIQLTNSRLLEKLKLDPLSTDYIVHSLEKIQGAVDRINKIIKGLTNLSRNAANEDIQVFSVENMMEQVLSLVGQKLKYSNVDLRVSIPPGDLFIESSLTQISQVLINLINNANDAIAPRKDKWIKVDFKLVKDSSIVRCSVTDSGEGIPSEIAEKIMQPFFTTKEMGKGTGLGLSISKEIIETLGGKFYIDDESPNTCFVFELPKVFKR